MLIYICARPVTHCSIRVPSYISYNKLQLRILLLQPRYWYCKLATASLPAFETVCMCLDIGRSLWSRLISSAAPTSHPSRLSSLPTAAAGMRRPLPPLPWCDRPSCCSTLRCCSHWSRRWCCAHRLVVGAGTRLDSNMDSNV